MTRVVSVGPVAAPETVWSYTVCDEIGSGGMATVHLGMSAGPCGFRRPVAMKRIRAELPNAIDLRAALRSEALLGSHIRHPNVVAVLDLVEADDDLYLVMEHIVGETFGRLLRLERKPPIAISVAIMSGVLRGLHAAHVASDSAGRPLNIVHRDVSPSNILIGVDGTARLIDFGVAKATSSDPTCVGYVKGKVGYFAPEQFFREPLDARTDVFTAGIVLWEAVSGRRLFRRCNPLEDVLQLATQNLRPVSDFNSEAKEPLDAVLARALQSSRERRFDTAEQFAEALESAVRPSSPSEVARYLESLARPAIEARRARLHDLMSGKERAEGTPLRTLSGARKAVLPRAFQALEDSVTVVRPGLPGPLEAHAAKLADSEAAALRRLPGTAPAAHGRATSNHKVSAARTSSRTNADRSEPRKRAAPMFPRVVPSSPKSAASQEPPLRRLPSVAPAHRSAVTTKVRPRRPNAQSAWLRALGTFVMAALLFAYSSWFFPWLEIAAEVSAFWAKFSVARLTSEPATPPVARPPVPAPPPAASIVPSAASQPPSASIVPSAASQPPLAPPLAADAKRPEPVSAGLGSASETPSQIRELRLVTSAN